MDVILLEDVDKIGLRGDVVSVARGYARNFLFPRRLAEEATDARVSELRKRETQRARHEASNAEQAETIADTLRKTVLRFDVKAGPTGALFGSVTPTNIADELWRTRKIRVDRRKIGVENIKRIGRYDVPIDVFQDVRVEVKTLVVPEGGELPSEEELEAMEAAEAAELAAQQAAAAPESGPAEEDEVEAEEIVATPEDRAAESASDDFDESIEVAAEEQEL
jgi:large subunit ribosomal protein L9